VPPGILAGARLIESSLVCGSALDRNFAGEKKFVDGLSIVCSYNILSISYRFSGFNQFAFPISGLPGLCD
jgi:hypothetical protein